IFWGALCTLCTRQAASTDCRQLRKQLARSGASFVLASMPARPDNVELASQETLSKAPRGDHTSNGSSSAPTEPGTNRRKPSDNRHSSHTSESLKRLALPTQLTH